MGALDWVAVVCPVCQTRVLFQTKGAHPRERAGRTFELASAPDDVLSNVNRHSPVQCHVCENWLAVDEKRRCPIVTQDVPDEDRFVNSWYSRVPPP